MSDHRARPLPWTQRGTGHPVVFLHGFGLVPSTYQEAIDLLADRCRVIAPLWLYVEGEWEQTRAWTALDATLDACKVERCTLVGHSIGGALALVYAARRPGRIRDLVLLDALGASSRGALARRAISAKPVRRLTSVRSVRDVTGSMVTRPDDLMRVGWWGYRRRFDDEIATIARTPIRTHVVWAEHDSLLDPDDGQRLASSLDATFTLLPGEEGGRALDHDWPYRHPPLLLRTLDDLGVLT